MRSPALLVAGAGLGAGLAYFFDPDRGPRRRARIRDTVVHTATLTRRALGTTARDALHRTCGTAAALRTLLVKRSPVDDEVLVQRVRAQLGRLVSHPHAIQVSASNGVVTLRGPILTREADPLIRHVRHIRGVEHVVDQLDRHDQAGTIPSLQGGRPPAGRRIDLLQENWAPTTRALVGAAGSALAIVGVTKGNLRGSLLALAGVGMVARALTNLPLNRLTGIGARRKAVDIQKTITIHAPIERVFAFWSQYENFPRFMSRVLEVRPTRHPRRSHWVVAGPGGAPVEFDAEVTQVVENQILAWKTTEGSPVAHEGVVRFDPAANGATRVHIRMSYSPPAGWFGHALASAFGVDPKSSMDADLARMKTLIETGHPPHDAAERQRSH